MTTTMKRTYSTEEPCHACEGVARLTREEREVRIGNRSAVVEEEFYRCEACGEEYSRPGQMDAGSRRASARIREEDGLLAPEEIRRIRKRYGLTQREFERLLGVGRNTVVRWERGTVFQNAATDALLRLLDEVPGNAERLAGWHGVELHPAA